MTLIESSEAQTRKESLDLDQDVDIKSRIDYGSYEGSGVKFFEKQILSKEELARSLKRIAHEILEKSIDAYKLGLIGLEKGGVPIAEKLKDLLEQVTNSSVLFGKLDISVFRDDVYLKPFKKVVGSEISFDITDKIIVLVDDVIYTGRSVRAALDALLSLGRPQRILLAVVVDRGHRELPIRPDFVGKNLPTSKDEIVKVDLNGVYLLRTESQYVD